MTIEDSPSFNANTLKRWCQVQRQTRTGSFSLGICRSEELSEAGFTGFIGFAGLGNVRWIARLQTGGCGWEISPARKWERVNPVCQLLVISYQLSERIVISKHWESLCFCLGVSPLLQKKKESRVKLAPTSTSPYIFIEKTTETQTFMLPRSFRLGACCLTILTLLRQIPML